MPIVRRALTVAAVTAAGTVAFAVPAWAHTAHFDRECDLVKLHLDDNFPAGTYTISVLRNGNQFQQFTYTPGTDKPDMSWPESNEGDIIYQLTWSRDGDNGQTSPETEKAPTACEDKAPPTTEAPPTTGAPESPEAPSTTPAVAPAATTPAPTPSPAVEASRLANTGASNTVPMTVAGSVLVAGGVALTMVTRRRRRTRRASI